MFSHSAEGRGVLQAVILLPYGLVEIGGDAGAADHNCPETNGQIAVARIFQELGRCTGVLPTP